MKKILYITHLSGKRVNRFWISAIYAAQALGYEFHLACNMTGAEHPAWEEGCKKYGIITHQIDFNRNPLSPQNIKAQKQLTKLLKEGFDVVHCNTPVGGLVGRISAKKAKIPKIIYQAHGFHFWKGAPLHNWLLYYPVERLMAHKTDVLITINQEDYERAKKFRAKRVVYVSGVGIDTDLFSGHNNRVDALRNELGIPKDAFVILSVGELITRKNHQTVIEALKDINDVWYVICGLGPLHDELVELTKSLGMNDRVILTGYRTDVMDFYSMADLFVFPSYQEGLPVALLEAMSSGLPCVVSEIRGNTDLIKNESLRFSPNSRDELKEIILREKKDQKSLSEQGLINREIAKDYSIKVVVEELKKIYSDS